MNLSQTKRTSKPVYREELILSVVELSGLSKAQASLGLKSMLKAIQQGLKEKHKVRITGFGTFRVSRRRTRQGRDPYTGTSLMIPETLYPIFRTGKMLRGWDVS